MQDAGVTTPKIWRSITIGTYRSGVHILQRLRECQYPVDESAEYVLRDLAFPVVAKEEVVRLARVTVGQLGLTIGCWEDVCDRARALGLRMCRPEVGPVLRIRYHNQPNTETLYIATQPWDVRSQYVANHYVTSYALSVTHAESINELRASDCRFWPCYHARDRFVFEL